MTFNKSLLLPILGLSLLLPAFASALSFVQTCEYLLGGRNRVLQGDAKRSMAEVEPFTGALVRPAPVKVLVSNLNDGTFVRYYPQLQIVTVNSSHRHFKQGLPPEFFRALIQHEYGHSIFLANMAGFDPRWKRFYISVITASLTGNTRLVNDAEIWRAWEVSLPYQELFADLFPMLVSGDPDVAQKLLAYLKYDGGEERAFDRLPFDCKWTESEAHGSLAPARAFLWTNYFAKPKNKGREGEIVTAVMKTIAARISDDENNYSDPKTRTSEYKNRILLNAFKAALVKFE